MGSLNLSTNKNNQFETNPFVCFLSWSLPFHLHCANIELILSHLALEICQGTKFIRFLFVRFSFALRSFFCFCIFVLRKHKIFLSIVLLNLFTLFPELYASSCVCCHQWIVVLFTIRKLIDVSIWCARDCTFDDLFAFVRFRLTLFFSLTIRYSHKTFGIDGHAVMRSFFSVCLLLFFCCCTLIGLFSVCVCFVFCHSRLFLSLVGINLAHLSISVVMHEFECIFFSFSVVYLSLSILLSY